MYVEYTCNMAVILYLVSWLVLLSIGGQAKTPLKRNECGGSLSGPTGSFTSPNYPNNYPNNADCTWTIQGTAGSTSIQLTFNYLNIEYGGKCEWDAVIVKDKEGKLIGKKLCGSRDKVQVTIPGDRAVVVLKSDSEVNEKGFDASYVAKKPGPKPTPGSCDFDNGLCPGITNVDTIDNFDWTVRSGPTPSMLTGPSTDHSGKGKYVYIESTGRSKGDKAELQTPVMTGTQCLTFYYHMYGIVGMGTFNVYTVTTSSRKLVMSLSGNQGDEWKKAQVQIRENDPYKVVFEGIVASDYSDIAIDDIVFSKSVCNNDITGCGGVLTTPSGSFTSPGYPNNYKDNLRCKWIIRPQAAQGSVIVVRFTNFQVEMDSQCSDDYVTVSDSKGQPVSKKRFCGYYGNGFGLKVHGNEAVVNFFSNGHLTDKGFSASYETIASTSPGDCDFDAGLCPSWSNSTSGGFNWSIGKGTTPSFFTGPQSDIYILGNYAFIEASGRRPGENAVLISKSMSGPQCLTFHYSMNGQLVGSLGINVINSKGSKEIWKTAGDHGKFWLKKSVNVDGGQSYQVAFEGVVSESFTSDIAIDEISFTKGSCSQETGCNKILTAPSGSFNSPNFPSPYPSGVDCTWTIIPPPQYQDVAVTFHNIDMEKSLQCSKDYIAVEDITGTIKGNKLCGKIAGDKAIQVNWHKTNVHFHSDGNTVGKGFEASYKAFGVLPVCGGQLSGKKGTFQSPNYPNNYPNRVTCDWEITAPPNTKEIVIHFEDFAIDDSPVTCAYDYVLVYDAQHGREVGKVCGMHRPHPIHIKGNVANVRFQSSHVQVARGFKAHYITV